MSGFDVSVLTGELETATDKVKHVGGPAPVCHKVKVESTKDADSPSNVPKVKHCPGHSVDKEMPIG
jgi:hypothetical protein